MTDNTSDTTTPLSGLLGSLRGERTESGSIRNIKASGSFDDLPASNAGSTRSATSGRSRLMSEEDEEIRMAKAMALAIQNNPGANPEEIRALAQEQLLQQEQLYMEKQQKEVAKDDNKEELLVPGRLANVMASSTTAAATTSTPASPGGTNTGFHKLQESIKQTRAKAQERLQGIVGTSNSNLSAELVSPTPSTDADDNVIGKSITAAPVATTTAATNFPNLSINLSTDTDLDVLPVKKKKVRLVAVVWKRRSGLAGKFNKVAWERRRIVLRDSDLEYYTTGTSGSNDEILLQEDDVAPVETTLQAEQHEVSADGEEKGKSWFEQAGLNFEKAKASAINSLLQQEDPHAPRGVLDLVKERATVGAASGHSGAPTPFAISIKVKGETKWKFCFDAHETLMEWLVALTDVVVAQSVDAYNHQLLQAADPSAAAEPAFPFVTSGRSEVCAPPTEQLQAAAAGHQLWMMDSYNISSQGRDDDDDDEHDDDDCATHDDDDDDQVEEMNDHVDKAMPQLGVADGTTPDANKGRTTSLWSLTGKDMYLAAAVVNTALVMSHASSTTPSRFWYVATFANVALYLLMKKEEREETHYFTSTATRNNNMTNVKTKKSSKNKSKGLASQAPKKPGFKPMAGSSAVKIQNPTDVPTHNDHIFAGWRAPDDVTIALRSHGYLTTKQKVPSPGTMYDCTKVDVFESPNRYPDMAPRVHLPKVSFPGDPASKTWRAPDIFVISVSLPTDPPKFTASSKDGGGYTVTMYYTMRQDTRDILKRVTAEGYDASKEVVEDVQKSKVNAVKLFEEWCRRAPTDPKFMTRFKLVANGQNLKEIGVPGWIGKYNGKPVLIKRPGQTGFLYSHPELSCMEFDISLHPFPYLAKQAICYLKENFFKKVLVSFGFVIEGRADDELPECLIGIMQLCYPDPIHAIQAADVFSGASAKSHD